MSDEKYQDSEISVLFSSRLNWKKSEEICHILPNKLTLYFRNCIYLRICLLVPVDLKIIQQPQWVEEWDAVNQGEAILNSEKNKRKSLKTKVLSDDFAVILKSELSDGFTVIHIQTFRKKNENDLWYFPVNIFQCYCLEMICIEVATQKCLKRFSFISPWKKSSNQKLLFFNIYESRKK